MMYLLALVARRTRARLVTPLCCAAILFGLWAKPLAAAIPQPPGGPILLITNPSDPFSDYYQEILFNEGLNAFAVRPLSQVDAGVLAAHDVAILAQTPLNAAQVTMFSNWVAGGGRLIAMRPDKQLAGLLGLADASSTLAEAYLLIDTSKTPGEGLVNQTIQFHGTADRYTLAGAESLATLYANATTPTANPALALRTVGAGQAAAFTYDLARSVVYTRQGNPAWAAQERDGFSPIRSDDKFFGNAAGDPQSDWVNLNKVAIPQADEHQRLLANLILKMNAARKPLPRFWYFPRGEKAVVLMTGDDHGNNGTEGRFHRFQQQSPAGCSVPNWECVRGTSYVFPRTSDSNLPGGGLSNADAVNFNAQGFEISLHLTTFCSDFTPASLRSDYGQQLAEFGQAYPGLPAPITQRHHCIVWSDWVTGAVVQLENGIRLDTNYYYWPPSWVQNRPGFFNGSGMPMRFADLNGTRLDVYLTESQMTDESGQDYPFTIDTLLNRALGAEGYYGVFTVNAHTDWNDDNQGPYPISDAVVTSALARGVPVITARQLLTWLDGRNQSSFGALAMSGPTLTFTVTPHAGAVGLQAMLPTQSAQGPLSGLTRNGSPVSFSTQTLKGVQYALFSAAAGSYAATYGSGNDTAPPTVTARTPAPGETGVALGANVTVTFSEAMDAATIDAGTVELRGPGSTLVTSAVTYNAATLTATLNPNANLEAATSYTATVICCAAGVKDVAGNPLAANATWSFTTAAADATPPTIAARSPLAGASDVPPGTVVTATFSEAMDPATINGTTFELRQGTTTVPAAISYDGAALRATLDPSNELAASTTYTATVKGGSTGVKDLAGNPLAADSAWSFTTAAVSGPSCPCTIWPSTAAPTVVQDSDTASVELGVKFTANTAGFITAIRFYKGPNNTGPHVATLWSAGGQQLAQATISDSGSGWQQANFGAPVAIAANTVYIASYHANVGRYSADENYFASAVVNGPLTAPSSAASGGNGVYAYSSSPTFPTDTFRATNYWVDVVFVTDSGPDTTPPTVTATVPTAGATGVAVGAAVTATFSEAMNGSSINGTTVQLHTGGPAGPLVAASVTYSAATRIVTLTPSSPLAASTTYTATLSSGITDVAGNALTAFNWSFTTAAAGSTTITLNSIAAQDGYVIESGENTNVGGSATATGTGTRALRVGDTSADRQQKSIVSFDSSAIPDSATIVSTTLRLRRGTVTGTNPFTTHGTCWVDVVTGAFGGNTALQAGDFQAAATAPQAASLSNAATNGAWSEAALDAGGLAAINKTGVTQFRVYFALDDNDDVGADEMDYHSGEAAAANRPQLVVTYQ